MAAQPPNFFARVFLEEEGGAEHTLEQAPQGGPRVVLEEEGGAAVVALDSSRLQNRVFGFWRRRGAIPFRGNLDSSSRFWGEEETGPTLTRASGRFRP